MKKKKIKFPSFLAANKTVIFTCRFFPSRRFRVEDEGGQEEDAADDFGPANHPGNLKADRICINVAN